jgi:putative phage-type endonuclease
MITEEQRKQRMQGIGATDAAAVLGIHPHMTPYDLWLIKTGRKEQETILTPQKIRIRNAHEATIADEYAASNNVVLVEVPDTLHHPKHKFLFCHMDRKVVGLNKVVECKSSISWMAKSFGQSGSDEVPPYYLIQMQYFYLITGWREGDIAALIDIDDFRVFPIPANEKLIAFIEEKCIEFWTKYVMCDVAPPLETRNDVAQMFPTVTTAFQEAPPAAVDLFVKLSQAHLDAKKLEEYQEKLKDNFTKLIQGAEGLKLQDRVLCTWKANAKGTRVLRINYDAGVAA